jgi:hypothetical protein
MDKYLESLKYAQYILRLRDGLIDGSIGQAQKVTCKIDMDRTQFNTIKGKRFYTEFGQRPYTLGHLHYKSENKLGTLITSKTIDFHQDSADGILTVDGTRSFKLNPNYDEGQYFQDSLLYSDRQLHFIVVANLLYANPMEKYNNFKLYFRNAQNMRKLLGEIE